MKLELGNDWSDKLAAELREPYLLQWLEELDQRYAETAVYPPKEHLLRALETTPYAAVKAVILGQDPYHGAGQSHGLCFSVQRGVKLPPSLKNIYKELESDTGCKPPSHGCLEHWAMQGVLLLNTVLTVEDGRPGSHQKKGWERFTDRIIGLLNEREQPVVFVLWGRHAQAKLSLIDTERHPVVASAHPSPLSARTGFFGSKPFSAINRHLEAMGRVPIDWAIPD